MKKRFAIVHLSDLHLQLFENESYKIESLFNKEFEFAFEQSLAEELKTSKAHLEYIIISGDIANKGKNSEYNIFKDFIDNLKRKFSIKDANIILTPGNHDIDWAKLESHRDESIDKKEPNLYFDVKFDNFKKLFNSLNNERQFVCDKSICDLHYDNNIVFLSLNSCLKESYLLKDHYGYIDFANLKKELEKIDFDSYGDCGKIAIFHHNPIPYPNDNGIENWNNIESLLNSFGFFVFLFGHRHKDDSKVSSSKEFNYFVSVGSFAKKGVINNSYNLLIQDENEKFTYYLTRYFYIGSDSESIVWQDITKGNYNRIIKINSSKVTELTEKVQVSSESIIPEIISEENDFINEFELTDSVKNSKSEILKFIRNNSLFKTGHFHWSESFRTHGLIDTNYLLSNSYAQRLIKDCFIELIKKNSIDFDLLVGVGMEGNIIGATLSNVFLQSDYTFIPDISSQKSYNEFETRIKTGNYKKIAVIKDVVFQADAFLRLIDDEKNKQIFDDSISVSLLTLFFCGNKKNKKKLNNGKVKFYYLIDEINIERCPYKSKTVCPIVDHKLDSYYEFFSK